MPLWDHGKTSDDRRMKKMRLNGCGKECNTYGQSMPTHITTSFIIVQIDDTSEKASVLQELFIDANSPLWLQDTPDISA